MKKITLLILLLMVSIGYSQTNSTGEVMLSTTSGLEYSAQIDVTSTEATLTLVGPSDRWLGLGFGVTSMTSGGDVVIFDGTSLTDRTFQGVGSTPTMDTNQDWSITFNDVAAGVRTLTATRALNTGEANDYVFNLTDTSINLVWARGNGSFTIAYHGGSNRGITSSAFTLGVDEFALADFKISPNPVTTNFEVTLPASVTNANVAVYDVLGKQIYTDEISEFNSIIDASNWNSGIYMVRVSAGNASQTKRIIKQ